MKAILTQLERFTSKKGGSWVRISGFAVKGGKAFSTLISGEMLDKSGLKPDVSLTEAETADFEAVEINFDQNGRIDSVESAE